jgi:hypothetical protein
VWHRDHQNTATLSEISPAAIASQPSLDPAFLRKLLDDDMAERKA